MRCFHSPSSFVTILLTLSISLGTLFWTSAIPAATSVDILNAVKDEARKDAEAGLPLRPNTIGERYRENDAGLSPTLISIIYSREYRRLTATNGGSAPPADATPVPQGSPPEKPLPETSIPLIGPGGYISYAAFGLVVVLVVLLLLAHSTLSDLGKRSVYIVVGAIVGLFVIRGFFLDASEELGWRLFWSAVTDGHMSMESLWQIAGSATFAKTIVGMLFGGIGGFIAWEKLASKATTKPGTSLPSSKN